MPSYRVRPGTIPKHLKIPAQPSPTSVALPLSSVKPPIRKASTPTSASIPQNPSILSANHIGQFPKAANPGTFQIPRFGASKEGWSAGKSEYRNVANVHPFAKLKDPLSVRAYDWIVRLSVPTLLLYFLFWSEAGEKSDIAILRRWSEGLQQDVKDWWNNVPKDEEVDPRILLQMEQDRHS